MTKQTLTTRFVVDIMIIPCAYASYRWCARINIARDDLAWTVWLTVTALAGSTSEFVDNTVGLNPFDAVLAVVLWVFVFRLKYFAAMTHVADIIDVPI